MACVCVRVGWCVCAWRGVLTWGLLVCFAGVLCWCAWNVLDQRVCVRAWRLCAWGALGICVCNVVHLCMCTKVCVL